MLSSTDRIWNLGLKGTGYTTDGSSHLPRLPRAPHADTSQKVAVESHEVGEAERTCQQTKRSLSVCKKRVFCGTLEWILLPPGETNWSRQASLPE